MSYRQGKLSSSKRAKRRGELRRRRRKRAERREATAHIREAVNEKRRAEGHPGWARPESSDAWW